MEITFDPVKNKANIRNHSIDLAEIEAAFYDPTPLPAKTVTKTKNGL
jgi:uncharacterized DUF497 family protein